MKVLFDNFDLLVEGPDGIRKLRELILQLAVMGKLVPQDPNDEPAAVLLEKIKAEKERLIKDGKIKSDNPLPDITDAEKLYNLPKGWEWVRLNTICNLITDGTHHTPKYVPDGIPFLSVKDISHGKLDFSNSKYISKKEHDALVKRCHPEYGDVLLTKVGTTGIAKAIDIQKEFSIFVSVALLKLSNNHMSSDFIELLLNSPLARRYSKEGTEGVGNKNLVLKKIKIFAIPLPPLNEQKRIVEKVERLMGFCDELEKKKGKRDQKRVSLNNASLEKLLASREADEFREHWRQISENFDILYYTPGNVVKLKQAILQLAVMGKLVPQDPNDEPASVLLEKIKAEKERLIKEGKIKRQNPLPPIAEDEIPYQLLKSWVWIRIRDICHDWGQKKPDKDFVYIDVASIDQHNGVVSNNTQFLSPDTAPSRARKIVKKDSIIYATVRPYLLNIAIIDKEYEPEPIASTAFAVLHTFPGVFNRFVYYYLRSQPFITYVEDQMIGVAYPAINDAKFFSGLLPLPPLNEQKRIVAKVERLMSFCDQLQENLKNTETKSDHLFNAVVNHLQDLSPRRNNP